MAVADGDLKVGDRVSRLGRAVHDPPHLGTVIEVYTSAPGGAGRPATTLYGVHWDDTQADVRGYMRGGLTKLAAAPTR